MLFRSAGAATRSVTAMAGGKCGALAIILLSADFYIPMRLLGSFFHVAMNGMSASDKIFRLLDAPEPTAHGMHAFPVNHSIQCRNLHFSYQPDREIIHDVDLSFPHGSFRAIVGESGCGKSTIASILLGRNHPQQGNVTIGGLKLHDIAEKEFLRGLTDVGFDS